jgi:hypothetical protein
MPFSLSTFFCLALALFVVDKTAVATFSTFASVGTTLGGGYAKREGFALDKS